MTLNSLYNNFKATIVIIILKYQNKIIKKIYQILTLTEVKLASKHITRVIGDLAMTTYKKNCNNVTSGEFLKQKSRAEKSQSRSHMTTII